MTRCAVFVACVGAFCLGITPTASAEPITITGGSLVFLTGDTHQSGSISLTGTRGFSLQGFVDSGETFRWGTRLRVSSRLNGGPRR